jgi:DNA-binding FadR family transcriptional regulator
MDNSQKIHVAILASFKAGDAEAAERIRRDVLIGQIERFSEIFEDEENE